MDEDALLQQALAMSMEVQPSLPTLTSRASRASARLATTRHLLAKLLPRAVSSGPASYVSLPHHLDMVLCCECYDIPQRVRCECASWCLLDS